MCLYLILSAPMIPISISCFHDVAFGGKVYCHIFSSKFSAVPWALKSNITTGRPVLNHTTGKRIQPTISRILLCPSKHSSIIITNWSLANNIRRFLWLTNSHSFYIKSVKVFNPVKYAKSPWVKLGRPVVMLLFNALGHSTKFTRENGTVNLSAKVCSIIWPQVQVNEEMSTRRTVTVEMMLHCLLWWLAG